MVRVYPESVRQEGLGLLREGLSAHEVGRRLRVHPSTVGRWAKLAGMDLAMGHHGGIEAPPPTGGEWADAAGRLTESARGVIQIRLRTGLSFAAIARELGVSPSTVTREVTRHGGRGRYRARWAQRAADLAKSRARAGKLDQHRPLRQAVIKRLNLFWSPEQIAADLKLNYPDRAEMQVSHETIYQALYVQGKGTLRHELEVASALRQGQTRRRKRSKLPARGNSRPYIGDEARYSSRPAEIDDRAVPGHWEGDLVMGAGNNSAVITLVERTTRFTLLARLPGRHDAATVADTLIAMISGLPEHLRRTLTWDQGIEMAHHARFTLATACQVYFCDPHSPWQRGTNENTNGLLRQFYPKGTDFARVHDDDLADTQTLLNTRPRATLAGATPAAKLNELLHAFALTA